MHVDAWLPRAAAARPDHPAVNDLTYAELLHRARVTAAELTASGVRRGDRVPIALPPGEDFAVVLHACLLGGFIAAPTDPPRARHHNMNVPGTQILRCLAPQHEGAWHRNVNVPGTGGMAERHDLDATAVVVRTSGTTSEPKEVALSYGNWLWSALGSAAALGHPPDERWLSAMPLTHVGGLSILLRSVIAGTTVVLHERWSTEAVLRGIDDATIVSLVPTTLARLLDAGLREPPGLRWALVGGAPIPPRLLDRAREAKVPVAPTYGLTEACSQVATNGVPLFCTRVTLAEPDGEIVVAGPTVSGGGPLRTGDLGRFDARGRLHVVGRKADTIITGGENVAPAEVEAVLETHPAVAEAAVVGRPDPEWGEAVTAVVRLRDGARITAAELRAHAEAALEPFKVPKAVAFRSEPLPRTASGKLLRRELTA